MALRKATLTDLRRELRTLQTQYVKWGERIEVLQKILADDRPREAKPAPPRAVPRRRSRSVRGKVVTSSDVLNALRQHPGSKAAALAKVMEQQGFKTTGRMSHRVYNELWRS